MTRLQFLLTKLTEENLEIGHVSLKAQQFGMASSAPGTALTNQEHLHLELDDLMAVVEMLNEEFGFGYAPNRERIEAKKRKVNQFAEYSAQLGLLTPE